MSLLTTTEVAAYLGIDDTTAGLQEAIDNAEAMVAGQLNLIQLDEAQHNEIYQLPAFTQQIVPKHGPITSIDTFTLDGVDKLAKVTIDPSGWAIILEDFTTTDQHRIRGFGRFYDVDVVYTAGWTAVTIPLQVKEYVKAMVGLTLTNLLASGVYDVKLGDMTIKIQREVLQQNLQMYEPMLKAHRRPSFW